MEREKKLDLFNENKLQNSAFVRGGTSSVAAAGVSGEPLSALELSTVVFEEEGDDPITGPFGKTTYCYYPNYPNLNPCVERKDFKVFGLTIKLNSGAS